MVYKMYQNCIPVFGSKRIAIYDLQRGNLHVVESKYMKLIKQLSSKKGFLLKDNHDDFKKMLSILIKDELVFETDIPFYFNKYCFKYILNSEITNIVIEIDVSSEFSHDFDLLFKMIDEYNCGYTCLIFYNVRCVDDVMIVVNIINQVEVDYLEIWVNYFDNYETIIEYMLCLKFNIKVVFYCCDVKLKTYVINNIEVVFVCDIDVELMCKNNIDRFIVNQYYFSESLKYNTCLNGKVVFSKNGQIKNCIFLGTEFGNYKEVDIKQVVGSKSFKELWSLNKDKIEICNLCELRYACTFCIALSEKIYEKPLRCNIY